METGQNHPGKTDGTKNDGIGNVAKHYPDVYPFINKECVPLIFRKPFVRAVAFGAIAFLMSYLAATAGAGLKHGKDYDFAFTRDTIIDDTEEFMTEDMVADKSSYVDLGLSVKWATCNLGASAPEEFGDYYAWGETEPKDEYTDDNYKYKWDEEQSWQGYSKYSENDGMVNIESHDDAAVVALGCPWRMPTVDEMAELLFDCEWEWTTLNGVRGNKVTGPNGNWIFLPAAGSRPCSQLVDGAAIYLTSTLNADFGYDAFVLGFWDGHTHITTQPRTYGFSVRPVFK